MYGTDKSTSAIKVTVPDIRARKRVGPPIVVVTAYDFSMARLIDEAGVDAILVGDSLGMVVQGLPNTLPVTVDEVCYHGRAVARGVRRAHLVGDLPFLSYQVSSARAVESAGRLLKDGAFESVKLEGGAEMAEHVRRIVEVGIPVMGHVGLQPQSVHALGGFRVQGRAAGAGAKIVDDARAIAQAGAYAVVLEAIPASLADEVSRAIDVPTIGIGAGVACDGQVLVCTDLLGMTPGRPPKFVKRYAEVGDTITAAVARFAADVRARAFPAQEHAYSDNEGMANEGQASATELVPPANARH